MKKIVNALVIVTLLFSLTIPVYAVNSEVSSSSGIVSPQFIAIGQMSATLNINSSGKAQCGGTVNPSNNSYTSYLTVSLQQSTSGGWTTIKSWSGSGTGVAGVNLCNYWYVINGTYRVRTTASVYSSAGTLLETASLYSAIKIY